MSTLYFSRKQRMAMLKVIAANDPVMEALIEIDFNLTEGVKYAKEFFEKVNKQITLSGPLANNVEMIRRIEEQLPSGEVEFPYRSRLNLGRMRALVRLVCLQNGYTPSFRKVKGQDRFYTQTVSPLVREDYGTVYMVPVRPMNEKARRFISLPYEVKRSLYALAY